MSPIFILLYIPSRLTVQNFAPLAKSVQFSHFLRLAYTSKENNDFNDLHFLEMHLLMESERLALSSPLMLVRVY